MEFYVKLFTIKSGWSIVYNCRFTDYNLKKCIAFLSLKINFILANIADPDEMQCIMGIH